MKIAIIGYGRMGHEVEKAALERGHEIVCRIDKDNRGDFDSEAFASADAAIEFTVPSQAFDNVSECLRRGKAVVSGTTGWTDRFGEIDLLVHETGVPMVWASNYSIGVNVFMHINRELARVMGRLPGEYKAEIEEIHHIHKLDHPSGTAITLANDIVGNGWYNQWAATDEFETVFDDQTLPVDSRREGEVPGTHIIRWDSDADTITLEHRAKNRSGFAQGAVYAAEWLLEVPEFMAYQPGARYSMSDVLASIFNK